MMYGRHDTGHDTVHDGMNVLMLYGLFLLNVFIFYFLLFLCLDMLF
jgi:hypothetical protein